MAEWRVTGVTESERVVVMAMLNACFDGFSAYALGRGNVKCGDGIAVVPAMEQRQR